MTAAEEQRSVICSRHQSGAILKDTNSIMHNDKEPDPGLSSELNWALEAALEKKALDLVVIEVAEVCSFTDNFIICTGTSSRHNQTIADGVEEHLRHKGIRSGDCGRSTPGSTSADGRSPLQ